MRNLTVSREGESVGTAFILTIDCRNKMTSDIFLNLLSFQTSPYHVLIIYIPLLTVPGETSCIRHVPITGTFN